MEIWIASGNKGKIKEYEMLLKGFSGLQIHVQSEISGYTARPEDGKNFTENARIKAKTLKAVRPNVWIFGEDSGLEVEGLGGLPGIHSARYAGPKASDSENVAKLLKMMTIRPMPNRHARFACSLVVYTPDGTEHVFEGFMNGKISPQPKGQFGFGYDPVFIPDIQNPQNQTLAELGPGYKNQFSHRAEAFKKFKEFHDKSKGG